MAHRKEGQAVSALEEYRNLAEPLRHLATAHIPLLVADAAIAELEAEVTKYKWQRDMAAARWSYWVSLKDKNPLRAQKWNPEDIIKHLEYRWAERRTG
jgi:hypothetical protein